MVFVGDSEDLVCGVSEVLHKQMLAERCIAVLQWTLYMVHMMEMDIREGDSQ